MEQPARTRLRAQPASNKAEQLERRKASRLRGNDSEAHRSPAACSNVNENVNAVPYISSGIIKNSSATGLVIDKPVEIAASHLNNGKQRVNQFNPTMSTPASLVTAKPTESPMTVINNIQKPDYVAANVITPITPTGVSQAMTVPQPIMKVIQQANPLQKTAGSPQREAIDYSRPMLPGAKIPPALRRLNKDSIKIGKNSQNTVLPGTSIFYKTPGANNRNRQGKIKRPMNAFMCFARHFRSDLCHNYPSLKNADISVKLGEIWRDMPEAQKKQYYDEAAMIRRQHRQEFPDWVYQPGQEGKPPHEDTVRQEQWRLQQLQEEQRQAEQMQAFQQQQQQQQQQQHSSPAQQPCSPLPECSLLEAPPAGRKPRKLHKNSYDRKLQGTKIFVY